MKCLALTVFCSLLALAASYDDVIDNDFPALVNSKERLKNFFGCIVQKSECDDFGNRIKKHIVESLTDGCNECDVVQKHYAHILIHTMERDFPEYFADLMAMYDPERKLLDSLDETVKKYW